MDVLAALTASLAVLLLAGYAVRSSLIRPADARLHTLASLNGVQVVQRGDGEAILRPTISSIPVLGRYLGRRGNADDLRLELERAGLSIRPGEYMLMRALLGVATFVVLLVISPGPIGLLLGLVLGGLAYMLPSFWVHRRARSRLHNIERQLTETIGLISNAQRSGFAFAQGVEVAAQRMGPPISVELTRMMLDISMGASTEDALGAMNERIGSEDLDLVVTGILIQRQTGGNLTEVLDNVTEIMRDRDRIHGDIRSMTASQRLSGTILSLWPAALFGLFFAINPSMMSLMWTTLPGVVMLITWGIFNFLAWYTIRRVLNIDY